MTLISDNSSLLSACDKLSKEVYLGVDTEFMRERTYYPKLCLIQISGEKDAIAVDALSPDINLTPVLSLLYNPNIIKVFHRPIQTDKMTTSWPDNALWLTRSSRSI